MAMYEWQRIQGLILLGIEKFTPLAFSFATGVAIYVFHFDICRLVVAKTINMANLYAAVLSWASIQIGFSFGVYGFLLGKTQGFVEAIRGTVAMRRLLTYVRRASLGGFILTLTSIPLAAIVPEPSQSNAKVFGFIACWFMLFVWTFLAFLRIAFNFGHLTAVPDKTPFYGA